jgi:hypothetical protein
MVFDIDGDRNQDIIGSAYISADRLPADCIRLWESALSHDAAMISLVTTGSEQVTVSRGESRTFTFTPNSGYEVDKVLVLNSPVSWSNNSYTIANVDKNYSIQVCFKPTPATYTLTTAVSPPATGTVSGGGTYSAGANRINLS